MELLIKLAEEASMQPELALPKKFSTYTSVYKVEGRPILPPLMTPERRAEMKNDQVNALAIEDYLMEKSQISPQACSSKIEVLPKKKTFDHLNRNTRDASTNTDFQPLVVMGRFRQKLHKSETLIYDNNCNAIVKPLKVSRDMSTSPHKIIAPRLIIEEEPVALAQQAIVQYTSPKFAILKTFSLMSPPTPKTIKNPRRFCQKIKAEQKTKADQVKNDGSILNFINVAKRMQTNMLKNDCLQRSNTSPILNNVFSLNKIQNVKRNISTERIEKLHPQLWQRASTQDRIVGTTNSSEPSYFSSSCGSSSNNDLAEILQQQEQQPDSIKGSKIRVKQYMSKEQPLRIRKPKPTVSKNLNSKTIMNSNSSFQKVATSQFNIGNIPNAFPSSSNCPPMNSVQRRLNYDPRASIKRIAQQKKIDKMNEMDSKTPLNTRRVTGSGPTIKSSSSVTDAKPTIFKNQLYEMEQRQRQRFQMLLAQQANEQKRLQDEFEIQQQALMDRILSDFSLATKENEMLVEEIEQITRGSEKNF